MTDVAGDPAEVTVCVVVVVELHIEVVYAIDVK
jgi:hypothetical protein